MFLYDIPDLNDILFGDVDPLQDILGTWETSQQQAEVGSCQECGKSYQDPIKNGCNPLLSLASSPLQQKLKITTVKCSTCDLRDMFEPYINTYSQDWEKGTVVINMSDVMPFKDELDMTTENKNLETDQIWNQVMKTKEGRSDYGSDSNFSDLNEFSDEFSDFLCSDDPGVFSDIVKSEDSLDDEDKMIDVESIDYNEILPGCSSHSAQVAQMHNYSTPVHLDSYHTPLGIRNLSRLQKKRAIESIEEDSCSPSSSDAEDRVEERCHMLSSTRIVKRRVVPCESSPVRQSCRRGRRPMPSACLKPSVSRKRFNSEERDYVPEQKRRKEFDDEKREQHNVLERIRRCEMSNLIVELQKLIPTLRVDKKHSKVVVLDAAAAFARSESKDLEFLLNREKQLDACISKLKRVYNQEP